MNENEGKKRKEWIKNAAIIFLVIMLVLTFFSNTIMNYSLPEVATQYVQRGSITAKVRGTGNVEANDPYNVIVKESRVIESVAVRQGDQVEKDQVLYYLEDSESDELQRAEDELEELELAYMKGLFGGSVSPEVISKVASGRTDSFASYQKMVTDMQNRLEAAEARVKECQNVLDNLNLQNTVNTNNASVSTIADELERDLATADMEQIKNAFENSKTNRLAELENQIQEKQNQIKDLNDLIDHSHLATSKDDQTLKAKEDEVSAKFENITKGIADKKYPLSSFNETLTEANIKNWYDGIEWNNGTAEQQRACEADYGEYRVAVDLRDEVVRTLGEYGNSSADQLSRLERLNSELVALQSKKAEVETITVTSENDYKDALNRLNQATRNISELTNADKQSSAAFQNQIANAEAALKNAQEVYELLKAEQSELAADINAELDLAKINKDIAEKRQEIEKLKETSTGAAITAPVAGTVTNLAYVAGETTRPEEAAAVIQVEGKGYTMSFSVTNEQAKKVQVGDTAELQNAWYYDDVQAILTTIKPDPDNPGQKKLLVFDVSGSSIQAGQSLSVSIGQRSADYEFVVPNSAVREDNNGKFILIVESKSSPLGNRYIATRVDVSVLASDDNNTAISAGLYGYEYVITTSTKPVEAGKQVRLNE